jgi:hypothetical protein
VLDQMLVASTRQHHPHRMQRMAVIATRQQHFTSPHLGPTFLAASSGLEAEWYADAEGLSNHMGLFLQKTNIIRDYLVGVAGGCG